MTNQAPLGPFEAFSDLAVALGRAVERVLMAPAGDLASLAVKVGLAVDEMAWELPQGEAAMARLKADAERLCLSDRRGASIRG